MKFYNESKMAATRKALEKSVLRWRGVSSREMMGCLCYFRGTKFFAFLVTNGIVMTRLSPEERSIVGKRLGGKPFVMAGRKVSTWVRVQLKGPSGVGRVLPYVKKSYDASGSTK